jgi:hypothetical protein
MGAGDEEDDVKGGTVTLKAGALVALDVMICCRQVGSWIGG